MITLGTRGQTFTIIGLIIVLLLAAPVTTAAVWNLTLIGFLGLPLPTADYWAGVGLVALFVMAMQLLHGNDRKAGKK